MRDTASVCVGCVRSDQGLEDQQSVFVGVVVQDAEECIQDVLEKLSDTHTHTFRPDPRLASQLQQQLQLTFTTSSPPTCRSRPRISLTRSGWAFHLSSASRSTGTQEQQGEEAGPPGSRALAPTAATVLGQLGGGELGGDPEGLLGAALEDEAGGAAGTAAEVLLTAGQAQVEGVVTERGVFLTLRNTRTHTHINVSYLQHTHLHPNQRWTTSHSPLTLTLTLTPTPDP